MQRFVTRSGRLLGVAAIAGALFLPAVLAQEGKPAGSLAERRDGAMTAEALREAPGQNRMVWVSAPRAAKLPTLDGTLNLEQGEWADAAAIPGMLAPTGSRLLPLQSLTLITWDEDSFYLGMRTEVKPGYVLRRRGREHDGAEGVNRDDAVEIFFNPLGRDQPEPAIFQVMFNALGFRWDAMQTVGVTAKYWDADTWEFKSDYKPGMTHWDLEVEIPARSMRMRSPNRSGDCWLFLATRDWKWLIDEKGSSHWNIYSSLTGNGGFISQENQFPLVLDDSAPVVQLLDISDLWKGRFGFKARFANTTARPQSFTALASVYDNSGYQGRDKDRSEREKPLAMQSKQFTLRPGEAVEWAIRGAALPEPAAQLYGLVFKVSRAGSATPLFVRQCDFTKLEYTAKQVARGYAIDIAYNPARGNLMPSCDILDHPDQSKVKGLRVELPPLLDTVVTRVGHHVISDLLPLPALKPGSYPARLTLLDTDGKAIESKELAVEKLDEAATFPWWDSPAGLSDKPIPPHQPMRVEGNAVITTTGRVAFDGRAMPTQVQMAGRELLAAPVRLTASAGGQAVAFVADAAPGFGRKTATEVELSGALRSNELTAKVANRMEYDGAQWITLDIEPAAPELKLDYLRLELPFKPERAQFLYTMAMAGRESWVAEDIANGEGTVWDSARCRGLGMTVGSFMPQYVVSDSLGGLCWYADNDRGWVPTDDVPAAEALRQGGETALRFNLIGKPFALKGPRRIQFGLLGLPARPFPPGARIVERRTSQFGHYVGDKVMNYSPPMPRDFAKAR
ncbi:MAG: hypothetical protein FJ291_28435, partial [Planctomycetes bacterium]|nr:hypothetical protein [Planctomycetota bacterium]